MSGGYLKAQAERQHQVVIFTFTGPISDDDLQQWNRAILALKRHFGARLTGITLKGDDSPADPGR